MSTKAAEPIEVPFGVWTWVGTRNHVLDGGPDPHPVEGAILGGASWSTVKYREYRACGQYSQPYSVDGSSMWPFTVSRVVR